MLLLLLIVLSLLHPSPIFADTPQYLTISPSTITLDLATDPSQTALTYTNNTNTTIELHLSAADFAPLEDGYKIQFLEGKDAANYKYSLSSWVSFDTNDFIINPHESNTVTVFIDKNRLTTGGHYGTIQAEWIKSDNSQVPLHVIVSSLVFVRTAHGNEKEQATIDDFHPSQDIYTFPYAFVLRVKNTGNVEINPHGLIEITDIFGNTVGKGIINEGSSIALPESIRRYDVSVTQQEGYVFPGFYHANMYIHFGKKNIFLRKSITFFSQGSINLIPYCIGIIILGFVLWKVVRKRYKN